MLMAAASEASAVAFLHNTFVAASVFHVQDLTQVHRAPPATVTAY